MVNNKNYDYWFNERLRGMGHPELIGQPRKHMDDKVWHDAHDWAARQLRREGFTSAKDRRRAGTDDRAAHDLMDDKSWAKQQGLENYLGGGAGGPAFNWIDPLGSGQGKDRSDGKTRRPDAEGKEAENGEAPGGEDEDTGEDAGSTDPNETVKPEESDDGYNLASDPAARQNYADKNDLMDRAEEAEQADDEEPGIGEDADAKSDLPEFQKEGGPGGPAKPEGPGISKAAELGGEAAKLGEAAEGAAAAETAAAAAATAAAETETVVGIAAFLGSGWGLVVSIVIAIIIFFLTLFMFQTLAAAFPTTKCDEASADAANGSVIVIDPGHPSELDSSNSIADYANDLANWLRSKTGATSGTSGHGVSEREVNQKVANYLQTELQSRGYDAILTKDNADTFMSNYDRGQLAKQKNATAIIKLHNDGNGPKDGIVFYRSNPDVIKNKWDTKGANGEYFARRKDSTISQDNGFAKALNKAFDAAKLTYASGSAYPSEVREHPSNAGFGYTYNIPTSLVEMASLKVKKDADFIGDASNQKKVAIAIADGVEIYFPKSGATVNDLGKANSSGYYQLPKSSFYKRNVNGGSPPSQQWGGKTLVNTILAVGQTWSSKHPEEKFGVGDLNAPGHKSHKKGIDVDIYSRGKLFMSLPGHSNNSNYERSLAIELGKDFIDTGVIDTIFYYDQAVVTAVNKYADDKKLPGKMSLLSQHDDHFHVRVVDGKDPTAAGGTAVNNNCAEEVDTDTTDDSGDNPAALDGDITELRKTWKKYRKVGKITKQSIGDIDGDVANGKVRAQTIRTALQMADYLDSKDKGPLEISVMKTGHKPGTLHWIGLAFDIGDESVAKTLMPWAYAHADELSIDELIYKNTAIGVSANKYNLRNGKPFNYSAQTLAGHTNHIHVGVYVDE